jgi:hypothetical protein
VLHETIAKSAQLFKLLRDLRRGDECALAAMNFNKATAHKILNGPANGYATHPESRNEAIFGWELVADLQVSTGSLASEDHFYA